MSSNDNNYQKYLEKFHSKSSASKETIDEVVYQAIGKYPLSIIRLFTGEVNEVFEANLKDRNNIILKINKSDRPLFLQEKWAIEQCRQRNLPVPRIHLLKHIPQNGEILSIFVEEKLSGDTLERGNVNMWELDQVLLQSLMRKSGEMLAKMHAIPIEGFGDLDGNGKGEYTSWQDMILEKPRQAEKYMRIAKRFDLPEEKIKLALQTISSQGKQFNLINSEFNHGDFAPKHILIEGDKVTGIIDFGDVLAHSPVFDFARWEYWYGQSTALDWLKEGYSDKAMFDRNYKELSHLIKLNLSLGTIWHYSRRNYKKGINHGIERMIELLKYID